MSHNIALTFVGTTSGGGPTETRNCSSLVVDALGNGSLWMVDCAEGTVRQFALQPSRSGQPRLRLARVSKMFITHMHADHTMGTLTFLRNVLGAAPPSSTNPPPPNRRPPQVEIYGPRGIRRMLRTLWHATHTHSEHAFVVHELLFPGEDASVLADAQEGEVDEADVRRESECVGRDITVDEDGFWTSIFSIPPKYSHCGVVVDAGPILHRDPCIGYIIREVPPTPFNPYSRLPRKLVILGDTHDPSPLIPLIHSDPPFALSLPDIDPLGSGHAVKMPVSLLVHEATDAFIPRTIDPDARTGRNRTKASVDAKTVERGHSTPAMAGRFARRIGAERLVLNHIGARFPAPNPSQHGPQAKFRLACMREIERQAAESWIPGGRRGVRPQAAWDFLSVVVPPNPLLAQAVASAEEAGSSTNTDADSDMGTDIGTDDGDAAQTEGDNSEAGDESPSESDSGDVQPGRRGRFRGRGRGRGRGGHRGAAGSTRGGPKGGGRGYGPGPSGNGSREESRRPRQRKRARGD
ncbi:beta-lactamase-like protein [Daedaleopsis nitida]|nr:beta-lactamase-like protein [Daedaleopsis nitida]